LSSSKYTFLTDSSFTSHALPLHALTSSVALVAPHFAIVVDAPVWLRSVVPP
jgi:hypothetical protein